ncbi:MAG TPA: T9SS type A sorting domain-containing protein [Saprospiraceae bacterium]|nr:T9SS type A sorting domain-containing protein [Saprospiraceae bacterium]
MAHKTFFQRNGGGQNILFSLQHLFIQFVWLLTLWALTPALASGQNNCLPVDDCDNFKLCSVMDMMTGSDGEYGFCACEDCDKYSLTPLYDVEPLNGVSTYDLVLISKHILSLEQFDSPYKYIAADANKSNTVTTFDIVEIRKLILGIYSEYPNNTSWRFIEKAFVFPNPANPFQTLFPETIEVPSTTGYNFYGIKIGDVNGTAVANSARPAERPVAHIAWAASSSPENGIVTLPVVYTGAEPLEAFQLGLRFDRSVLEFIGPSKGDLPAVTADMFGLTKVEEGEIRAAWLPDYSEPEPWMQQGAVLFYLTFRTRQALPESGLPVWLDDAVLPNSAWKPDGTECAVRQGQITAEQRQPADSPLCATCLPNPTTGDVTFQIRADHAEKGRLALFSSFGQLVFMHNVQIEAGEQTFTAPGIADLPAGVYAWKVWTQSGEKVQGHLVKQ